MRQSRCIPMFMAVSLLLTSCQVGGVAISLESVPELAPAVQSVDLSAATDSQEPAPAVVYKAANECLNCHSDKDLLIETASPEEADHEGESKGVG
jgi:hypothetical protein